MNAFVIKLIALICMVIDHTGAVFESYLPFTLRIIGRLAFPLYVFLIAEGCRHTRSMPKFLLRLGIFALISEIPYDLAFAGRHIGDIQINYFNYLNVFFTLFLGALTVYFYQWLKERKVPFLTLLAVPAAVFTAWLAESLGTDYGYIGVLLIVLVYIMPHKVLRIGVLGAGCFVLYGTVLLDWAADWLTAVSSGDGQTPFISTTSLWMLISSLCCVPLAVLYNNKRGPKIKWAFYIAYPAHILLLMGLWFGLSQLGIIVI